MLEKSAGIERFKYLSLDKELRAQTEFAKKQQARRNRGAMRDVGAGGERAGGSAAPPPDFC